MPTQGIAVITMGERENSMSTRTFVDVIASLERLNNSHAGNPRWSVAFKSGDVYRTEADASCNYGIENPELRGRVEVTVENRRGVEQITYLRAAR